MPNKVILLLGAAAIGLVGFGAVFTGIVGSSLSLDAQLDIAMKGLDEDDGKWAVHKRIAENLESSLNTEEDSRWHYILGVADLKSVKNRPASARTKQSIKDAVTNLQKAQELGFPAGYVGKGSFYMGESLYLAESLPEAIEQLKSTRILWPAKRSPALRMIVDAQMRLNPPDFAGAEETLNSWREIPGLAANEQAKISLATAELAFLQSRFDDCGAALDEVPDTVDEYQLALIWQGKLRLEKFHSNRLRQTQEQKQQLLVEADDFLHELLSIGTASSDFRLQALYLRGLIEVANGNFSGALSKFSSISQQDPKSSEAVASGLQETEILFDQGEYDNALATALAFLKKAGDLSYYDGRWLSLLEVKARLLGLARKFQDQGDYPRAIEMAENVAQSFPLSDSLRLKCEIYRDWATDIKREKLGKQRVILNRQDRLEVNRKFLLAAECYEKLARLELRAPDYTEIVWNAIETYQEANDLPKANRLLEDYIRYEDRTKRPRGFLALGRNKMNVGDWQGAIAPLARCLIEHKKHPVAAEVRLLIAQAYHELNEPEKSIALLKENLWGDSDLDPKNPVWRESFFTLGKVEFGEGDRLLLEVQLNPYSKWEERKAKLEKSQERFNDAIVHLGEAFSRWTDDPRRFEARFKYARAHQLASETPKLYVEANPEMEEPSRRRKLNQRSKLLLKAADAFRTLHQEISRTDLLEADEKTLSIRRNSYFGEANAYFDLERWEQAIPAYSNVTAQFQNQPESLEALVQLAYCYEKLGQQRKAKQTLFTAEKVLNRIPPELDGHFVSVTRSSRDGWGKVIKRMQKNWN